MLKNAFLNKITKFFGIDFKKKILLKKFIIIIYCLYQYIHSIEISDTNTKKNIVILTHLHSSFKFFIKPSQILTAKKYTYKQSNRDIERVQRIRNSSEPLSIFFHSPVFLSVLCMDFLSLFVKMKCLGSQISPKVYNLLIEISSSG